MNPSSMFESAPLGLGAVNIGTPARSPYIGLEGQLAGDKVRTSNWEIVEPYMRRPQMAQCSVAGPRATSHPTKGKHEGGKIAFLMHVQE